MRRLADIRRWLTAIIGTACVMGPMAPYQLAAQEAAQDLDRAARAQVIERLVTELNRAYVFPDIAAAMGSDLRQRLAEGAYDGVTAVSTFASRLTADLQSISHDKHLRVRVGGVPAAPAATASGPAPVTPFGRTERLDGDVAYIEIRTFGMPAERVRDAVQNVMSAAADAGAMILDLRTNGGGSPGLVALISSYLFDDEPVHLNSLYFRPADRTDDFYTDPSVPGDKYGSSKPVWVLTSSRTFSAAEEFAYNLQARGRATIVGETTGGGAHPGGVVGLPHGLSVFVPSGRAINPITRTNWEGTGVVPDVAVSAEEALDTALRLARGQARR